MYKLAIIRADGSIEKSEQENCPDLKQLRAAVGGYIEAIPYWGGPNMLQVAFCNEEGKLEGLPINDLATTMWYDILGQQRRVANDVLVGDIIVIQCDTKEEYMEL